MNRGLSLYLDLLRLVAAFEVFAFHVAGFPFLNVHRSAWNAYGHEAVTIFFVLSGFVIRHAAGRSKQNVETFATDRLTRVYSVAIPCLVLTLAFDAVGRALAPDYYVGLTTDGSTLLRLAIGATMLNEAWVSVQMLSNTPYWSISYEVWYYALFAALFYGSGKWRWILAAGLAIVAGPKIILLFPIWVMGWLAYIDTVSGRWPRWVVVALFVQPLAVLGVYEYFQLARAGGDFLQAILGYDAWRNGLSWSRFVLSDTLLGASVALHLIGAKHLGPQLWTVLHRSERQIRFGAAQSFTLYLLHQPALLAVAGCLALVPLGSWRGAVVAGVALVVVLFVAVLTEGQRHRFKPVVATIVNGCTSLAQRWSRTWRKADIVT
jgi:peptidoglycan/LPS O-acetylase OafA/YrhL